MSPADRAIVAAAEERDKAAAKAGWLRETAPDRLSAHGDRHELLRIVREQETALRQIADGRVCDEYSACENARDIAQEAIGRTPSDPFGTEDADPAQAEDRADDAAAEAEFLRPIGGGL